MRIIDPSAESSTGGRTVTMTARLVALRPSAADVFDALFLVGLVMLAILGFATSFAVGTLTLRALMRLLVRVGLLPFVPYLLTLAILVVASVAGVDTTWRCTW